MPPTRTDTRRDRARLVAATTAMVVVETAILSVLGPETGLALAPQASAPTPFDLFHDLRWISVYTPSWLAVAAALAAAIALRTITTAAVVGWAWPHDAERPPWRARLRCALTATVIVLLVLVPWTALSFATAVFSLSYPWMVAVPVVVMVSLLVHGAAVRPDWWRIRPPARALVAVVVALGAATAFGAAVASGPAWVRWPLALAAGVVNAWCWVEVTGSIARAPEPSRWPFAVVALGAVLALVLVGAATGFAVAAAVERDRDPVPRASRTSDGPPVLVVKGFNSRWDGIHREWVRGGFRVRRFSYAGVDDAGRPRPYGRRATHESVRTLARRMAVQVEALAAATGRPVAIVAESEGALIALTYVLGMPDAPVRSVVVLSPLVNPGRVSYPAPGRVGWGTGAGAALDVVAAVVEQLGPVDVDADTPLFRSIVEKAPLFQGLLECPAPGVRQLAVLPFDTAVATPWPGTVRIPYVVRPALHGGLLGDDVTEDLVVRTLRGRRVDPPRGWRTAERVVQALASPWQVPSLAKSLEPTWRDLPDAGDCRAVRRALVDYLGR